MLVSGMRQDTAAPLLTAYLAENDAPCPACGYNLRDLTTDRCPECSQRIVLSLKLQEPRTGPLIAAIAGLVTCSGAGAMLLAFVVCVMALHPRRMPQGEEFVMLVALPLVALVGAGFPAIRLGSHRGRVWFARLSAEKRLLTVLACWFAPAACLTYYVIRIG